MATELQIAANRANAQYSTGPRSEEGKAHSSRNNLRHGLTARGLIVLPGHEENFAALESGLRASLDPIGALQETLFTRILECAWNLQRCRLAEAGLYSNSDALIDPLLDDQNEAKYTRIRKYARQSENSMLRIMRELGKIQTESQYRREIGAVTEVQVNHPTEANEAPDTLSALCNLEKAKYRAARGERIAAASAKIKSREADRTFLAALEKFSAPPVRQVADWNDPEEIEEELEEVDDDAAIA